MKVYFTSLIFLSIVSTTFSQNLTGTQLLNKAIAYHDSNGNWKTFKGELNVTMETSNNPNRNTQIKINLPEEYFYSKAVRDTITTEFILNKDNCEIKLNGTFILILKPMQWKYINFFTMKQKTMANIFY